MKEKPFTIINYFGIDGEVVCSATLPSPGRFQEQPSHFEPRTIRLRLFVRHRTLTDPLHLQQSARSSRKSTEHRKAN